MEAYIKRLGAVSDFDVVGVAAGIRGGDGQDQLAVGQRQLHRAAALARYRGYTVDRLLEFFLVDGELLVVAERNDARIVRKRAIDEFGGEHCIAERETDLALGPLNGGLGLVGLYER